MISFKFWHYFILSSLLMFIMVIYACITREQFYPIILLLVTSKISFLLLLNMLFALTLLIGQIIIQLFYGKLRDVEYELILERSKYSITETCVALTIFRNDLSPLVFCFFLLLLFLKIFHWLSRSRLDYLEQVARVSISTHTMLFIMLILLLIIDSAICYNCVIYSLSKGKTVIVFFAFEFGVLMLTALNNLVRYLVNFVDGMYENGLNYKGLYFMILDLICDGLKFCTYAGFFCLVFVYYGLPIHIIRDVWIAFSAFYQRLISLIKYLKLTNRLEERFEDATPEELIEAHECLICREGMDRGKKLPCKHVFHLDCLRMWLQHQQTCPLCRADIPIVALPSTNQPNNQGNNQPQVNEQVQNIPQNNLQNRNNINVNNINLRHANILPEPAAGAIQQHHDNQSPLFLDETPDIIQSLDHPTSLRQIQNSIPGFFIVLSNDQSGLNISTIDVKEMPNYSQNNQIIRTIPQKTVVFATEFLTVTPPGEDEIFSIIWLHLPDGWVPLENFERNTSISYIITPLLRPYSPIVSKRTLLVGESKSELSSLPSSSLRSQSINSPSRSTNNSILPQSASSSVDRHLRRTRDSNGRREYSSRSHLSQKLFPSSSPSSSSSSSRLKNTSSPSSISRAIMKAKDDISVLSQSLREASNEQISSNSSKLNSPSSQKSTFPNRINRLLAMQQQIDILSSSILEIQESLTTIREGLALAMADEINFQESVQIQEQVQQKQEQQEQEEEEEKIRSRKSISTSSQEKNSLAFLEESSLKFPDLDIESKVNYYDKKMNETDILEMNEIQENKEDMELKEVILKDDDNATAVADNNKIVNDNTSDSQSNDIRHLRAKYFSPEKKEENTI